MAERLISADTMERTLGRVWCPIKGVVCKDLGENHFLITFLQSSGKRRAMEDGPWMISKDLLVVEDFDETKTLDEMDFTHIPIWVRVSNLPFGMMKKEAAEILGNKIGDFKEADVGEDGSAIGRVLRIKVIIDIRKPIMRGMMVKVGVDEKEKWCSCAYEFLPDFCYTCGRIGHIDKQCSTRLGPGETQQFSRALRFLPEKKRLEGFEERSSQHGRLRGGWSGGGSGSRGSQDGRDSRSGRWASSGSGSDAARWRKGEDEKDGDKDQEVQSPLKAPPKLLGDAKTSKKKLNLANENEAEGSKLAGEGKKGSGADQASKRGRKGSYKKVERVRQGQKDGKEARLVLGKRNAEESDEVVDEGGKKMKLGVDMAMKDALAEKNAGPVDRSCEA